MKVSSPPPPPAAVDPGKSALDYINAMSDPALQAKLLASEQMYRPQYAQLNLADMQNYLLGMNGQQGALDLMKIATERGGQIEQDAMRRQREADISDVEMLGGRATDALRNADPLQKQVVQNFNQMANERMAAQGMLSPEAMRNAQQQARGASLASGRLGSNSGVAAEVLNREAALQARRQEAMMANQLAFGANQATAADPFMAILGRPSQSMNFGMGQQGMANSMLGMQGPQLFNPDAGINLALQNASNLGNYQASTYGAKVGAQGAMIGGLFQGVGNAIGCWVAREVYGEENPKWKLFRNWLMADAPDWFRRLYLKHGERFAKFISNKPRVKNVIRAWMDSRIKEVE